MMSRSSLYALLFSCSIAATSCGGFVTPRDDGGSSDVAPSPDVAAFCALPNGMRCPAGTSCPGGVTSCGPVLCHCPDTGGVAYCPGLRCIDAGFPREEAGLVEAGTTSCTTHAQCGRNRECVFPIDRCTMTGRCDSTADCDFNQPLCGCDGVTYRGCRPDRPTQHAGVCETSSDAGATFDCDLRRPVLCNAIPPTCAPGEVNTVNGGCYGPCVEPSRCAPMACDGREPCPSGFECASGLCAAPSDG